MRIPVRIVDLAHDMIAASGRDIPIEIVGVRPGEKLNETLFDEFETISETSLPDVYRIEQRSPHAYISSADVSALEAVAASGDAERVRAHAFGLLNERLGLSDEMSDAIASDLSAYRTSAPTPPSRDSSAR